VTVIRPAQRGALGVEEGLFDRVGGEGAGGGVCVRGLGSTTETAQQIGASIGTALLNTIAATVAATALAAAPGGSQAAAAATVHGYAVASWFGAGAIVLAMVGAGFLVNADPRAVRSAAVELVEAPVVL